MIDVPFPGVSYTEPRGINNAGQIVGIYVDGTSRHGFLDTSGSFSTIDVPGARFPWVFGINASGQIVGAYEEEPSGRENGFLESGGSFMVIDFPVPGGSFYTQAQGINNIGQIVGRYFDAKGGHGYLYSGGSFSTINVPFFVTTDPGPFGINDAGQIVGYSDNSRGGFLATPVSSIPEPATWLLLGSGLIGSGLVEEEAPSLVHNILRPSSP